MLVGEYHVDGFRLDATHTDYMDHGFLYRLAAELRTGMPDVLLVAENLPNQGDLNLEGWNGYGQWSELFHDKLKALLREGQFEGQSAGTDNLGDTFYFSRSASPPTPTTSSTTVRATTSRASPTSWGSLPGWTTRRPRNARAASACSPPWSRWASR
jgi:hypothetical protein